MREKKETVQLSFLFSSSLRQSENKKKMRSEKRRKKKKRKKNVYYYWWYEWGICTLVWSLHFLSVRLFFPCLYSLSYRCESRANHSPPLLQFVLSIIVNMCRTQFFFSSWSFESLIGKGWTLDNVFVHLICISVQKHRPMREWSMISVHVWLLTERFVIGIFHSIFNSLAFLFLIFLYLLINIGTAYHVLFIDARNSCLWLWSRQTNDRANQRERENTIKEQLNEYLSLMWTIENAHMFTRLSFTFSIPKVREIQRDERKRD